MPPLRSDAKNLRRQRTWQAPALLEVPIAHATQATETQPGSPGQLQEPAAPAAPSTKLGFAFEMSFPLSVRTE